MPELRTSIAMQEQVRILHEQGKPLRKIAEALGLSRNTVRSIVRRAHKEVEGIPAPNGNISKLTWSMRLDWEPVLLSARRGRRMKDLYEELDIGASYSSFCRQLNKRLKKQPRSCLRLEHQPGEKTFVDYADGINVRDSAGEIRKTYLFCGVLPFSSLTFGEFVFDQKRASFIESHNRMWNYFGGVTPYVVIDNLKSGVTKAHKYDPDVNQTYCDYGNHCGFAVLPARPYTPRDKAAVEAAIGVIQRGFYSKVADRVFWGLAELNLEFSQYLTRLNNSVMKDHGVSRSDRFIIEREILLPLPASDYELSEWREAIVHPDCHLQVLKCYDSVPYQHIGQTVKVRIRSRTIEIFNENLESLAVHIRRVGIGKKSTIDGHEPDTRAQMQSFNIRAATEEAHRLSHLMGELVEKMFACDRPLRRLRVVQGILRTSRNNKYSKASIDYAAGQVITFQRYRTRYFEDCAAAYRPLSAKLSDAPSRSIDEIFVHTRSDDHGNA